MLVRFICAVILCVAFTIPGWSGLITEANVNVYDYGVSSYLLTWTCSDAGTLGPGGIKHASCIDPLGRGSAKATASYGSVSAHSDSSYSNDFAQANSFAEFQDALNIFGGMGPGTLRYIAVAYGSPLSHTGGGAVSLPQIGYMSSEEYHDTGFDYFVGEVPFTFGSDFDFTFTAEASAELGGGGFASADLVGMQVLDALRRPVPGAQIVAASGTNYPLLPVPEPSTFCLLLFGIAALGARGKICG